MQTQNIITQDEIKNILDNHDLNEVSRFTGITSSTLKNYKYGRTPLDQIPFSVYKTFTDRYVHHIAPNYPCHFEVDIVDWEALTTMVPDFDRVTERLNAEKHLDKWMKGEVKHREIFYIDYDSQCDECMNSLDVLLSIGLPAMTLIVLPSMVESNNKILRANSLPLKYVSGRLGLRTIPERIIRNYQQ